jgi:hypothetical protein
MLLPGNGFVLPLVPDTTAMRLPASSLPNALGSSLSITLPRIEAPVPRPEIRDAAPARRPASVAAVRRAVDVDMALVGVGRVVGHRTSATIVPRFLVLPP